MLHNETLKYKIITLGCKVNTCDSGLIGSYLENAGLSSSSDDSADVFIVNSCAVTAESERKSRNKIRHLNNNNAESIIIACGCWVRVNYEEAKDIKEADLIVNAKSPEETATQIIDYLKEKMLLKNENEDVNEDLFAHYFEDKTRASLKIQDGCNRFCSYCIIPYARGKLTSCNPDDVTAKINNIIARGCKEIVLTGIHLASYSYGNFSLIDLMEKIDNETELKRLRIGSLEPKLITEEFLDRLSKIKCFCPHFHLSLQSGSNSVLSRMNRRYTTEEYTASVNLIRKMIPNAMITTDIIVGFPGETDEEFNQTLEYIELIKFSHVHVFPYSKRRGTPAYDMPGQLTRNQKQERSSELIEKSEETAKKLYSEQIGKTVNVLVETMNEKGLYEGYSENYLKVLIHSDSDICGEIVSVSVNDSSGTQLTADFSV